MLQSVYDVDVRTDLTAFATNDGTVIFSNGNSTREDAPPLFYYYSVTSTATPDGDNVIKPTSVGAGAGRWLKRKFGYGDLSDLPSLAAVALSGNYTDLSGKPTIPAAQIQSDWTQASSGAADYVKNKPTIPTMRRVETYLGSTDGSGNYTVTYGTSFSNVPDIQPQLQGGSNTQLIKITSTTTSGFTVNVQNRTDTLGLLPSYAAVSGVSVGVLVTER